MNCLGPRLVFSLLLGLAAIALACGTSASSASRIPQSVSVNPPSATAPASGAFQFTATGYFSTPPSPVTPLTATWGACSVDGSTTTAVTVSNTGLAQCVSGASGTYTVWAFVQNTNGATCNVMTACGGDCGRVTGTAQLTCP
jgi:hypothetical protein